MILGLSKRLKSSLQPIQDSHECTGSYSLYTTRTRSYFGCSWNCWWLLYSIPLTIYMWLFITVFISNRPKFNWLELFQHIGRSLGHKCISLECWHWGYWPTVRFRRCRLCHISELGTQWKPIRCWNCFRTCTSM